MPNLPTHMELALRAADKLKHPVIDENIGYFLLGSTSPDIRVITRQSREVYHFTDLDFEEIGTGVATMFKTMPELREYGNYADHTQAFMAGYISHLIADETWIVTMFRRYFGNPDVFEDDALGKVYDRAMQLEMDRHAWDRVDLNQNELRSANQDIEIGFIPSETLYEWRDWILSFMERGFTWERLRFMARRIASGEEEHPAHKLVDDFVDDVDTGLAQLYEAVSIDDLNAYRNRTVESLVQRVGDYLS